MQQRRKQLPTVGAIHSWSFERKTVMSELSLTEAFSDELCDEMGRSRDWDDFWYFVSDLIDTHKPMEWIEEGLYTEKEVRMC